MRWWWTRATLAVAVAWRIATFIHATGELRHLDDVLAYSGRCERLHAEAHGYEDFAQFDGGGLITFASDHAHFAFDFGTSMRQKLAAKRASAAPPQARGLWGGKWRRLHVSGAPADFHPHGLAGRGRLRNGAPLLVVNHRTTHDTIERFSVRGHTLRHEQTLASPLLFNINDCAFREESAHEFYCTNWRAYETGTLADAVELYAQRPYVR